MLQANWGQHSWGVIRHKEMHSPSQGPLLQQLRISSQVSGTLLSFKPALTTLGAKGYYMSGWPKASLLAC